MASYESDSRENRYNIYSILRSTKDWVQLIKNLRIKASEVINFTEKKVGAISGGNAASILDLIHTKFIQGR